MTTVREFTAMLQALPEDQQDLPFVACLGHSPECYHEEPLGLYAQQETRFDPNYHDPKYPNRVRRILTGKLEHIRPI